VGVRDDTDDREAEPVAAGVPQPRPASRLKGWKRRSTSAAGTSGPELRTDITARPSLVPVDTRTQPPGTL
jgi:hypothetical protein